MTKPALPNAVLHSPALHSPDSLRAARAENPKIRDRDLAESLNVSEATLLAAHLGHGVTRIAATPDRIIPLLEACGPVMALTRNDSCVIEKTGVYSRYSGGAHAQVVLGADIDLRMFPSHWVDGYAVTRDTAAGPQKSVQIFDAAGDAVHKIYVRPATDLVAWDAMTAALLLDDQTTMPVAEPREPVEPARFNHDRAADLRDDWARMTDTHQFLRVVSRLKMNRLGAYRVAGGPFARRVDVGAVERVLEAAAAGGVPIMVFVGNRGCIEIHTGPVHRIVGMGPWINVLDPGFDLHLRRDHIAEVWAVDKPTQRGPAVSVECFDAQGMLIAQLFGVRKAGDEAVAAFEAIVAAEATVDAEVVA